MSASSLFTIFTFGCAPFIFFMSLQVKTSVSLKAQILEDGTSDLKHCSRLPNFFGDSLLSSPRRSDSGSPS